MTLLDIIGNLATIVTIISQLTGISICRSISLAGSTKEFSSVPFLVGVSSGYLWFQYGLLLYDPLMIYINVFGLLAQTSYLMYFYIYTSHKSQLNFRILLLMAFLFVINIYSRVSTDPVNLVGILCCLCSLLFCASPLTLVSEVIRTKSTEKLPFGLIFSSFLVTLLWFLYGYLTDDGFIQFPNAIGALISGVQLILFIVYPSKRKSLDASIHLKKIHKSDASLEHSVSKKPLLEHEDSFEI